MKYIIRKSEHLDVESVRLEDTAIASLPGYVLYGYPEIPISSAALSLSDFDCYVFDTDTREFGAIYLQAIMRYLPDGNPDNHTYDADKETLSETLDNNSTFTLCPEWTHGWNLGGYGTGIVKQGETLRIVKGERNWRPLLEPMNETPNRFRRFNS